MGVVGLIGVGLLVDAARCGLICLLSLPVAASGLAIACFHASLVLRGVLQCPPGLAGIATIPIESALLYVAVVVLLGAGACQQRYYSRRRVILCLVVTLVVALAAAWIAVKSSSPKAALLEHQGMMKECKPVSIPLDP